MQWGACFFFSLFFFESVHTLLHIFHALLVGALVSATLRYTELGQFARQYAPNVFLKFEEVKRLLLAENAGLTGLIYKSNRKQLLDVMGDLMKVWGSFETSDDFLNKFLLVGVFPTCGDLASLREYQILTQFISHSTLINGFASSLCNIFKLKFNEFDRAEKILGSFCDHTGINGPRVSSIDSWIQLMSVTGILHGATLSGTRLCCSLPVLKYFHEGATFKTFDLRPLSNNDATVIKVFIGTIVGMLEEHRVFNNVVQEFLPNPLIRSVELTCGGESAKFKLDYYNSIKNSPEFETFGWLWTDYCPDMIDSKQFTIASYI